MNADFWTFDMNDTFSYFQLTYFVLVLDVTAQIVYDMFVTERSHIRPGVTQ